MQKILALVDEANVNIAAKKMGRNVDMVRLRDFLADQSEGRHMIEMVIYVGMPPANKECFNDLEDKLQRKNFALRRAGLMIETVMGSTTQGDDYKANVDIKMAVDALVLVEQMKPDIVVLVTGDGDFVHLANVLRRKGVRVEAAGFERNMSSALSAACNSVIMLDELLNQFPSTRNGGQVIGSAETIFNF